MLVDELLTYLFAGQPHLLATPLAHWLASSRRFAAFVTTFRPKIRKKLWATQDLESLLDLRLELETAYVLLRERSFNVVYEPLRMRQTRGPDFAVTYTTSTLFMVEVTRLRLGQDNPRDLAPLQGSESLPLAASTHSLAEERLTEIVCIKLGQLPPQRSNVLLVEVEGPRLTPDILRAAMISLQRRAERNDAAYLQRHQFRDRADFFNHFQRLSELLVRGSDLQTGEPVIGWVNPQARDPLPSKVRTALYRSHSL
jgi:hypothetical protein